jgi:hypothetical protein
MFELALAYVNQAEREQRIIAGLRRHQILSAPHGAIPATEARFVPKPTPRATSARVRIAER